MLDYCVRAGVKGIVSFGFGTTMRDGSRDYFYKKLGEHFPGLKQRYIETIGNKYKFYSPNHKKLSATYSDICKKHGILHKLSDVFKYIGKFETKQEQLSLL